MDKVTWKGRKCGSFGKGRLFYETQEFSFSLCLGHIGSVEAQMCPAWPTRHARRHSSSLWLTRRVGEGVQRATGGLDLVLVEFQSLQKEPFQSCLICNPFALVPTKRAAKGALKVYLCGDHCDIIVYLLGLCSWGS